MMVPEVRELLGSTFHWRGPKRALRLSLAVALMFISALSVVAYLQSAAAVGAWVGLAGYEAKIAKARGEAIWFEVLAIILPFIAALVLAFNSSKSADRHADPWRRTWAKLSDHYVGQLIVSILGSVVFLALLWLLASFLHLIHPLTNG